MYRISVLLAAGALVGCVASEQDSFTVSASYVNDEGYQCAKIDGDHLGRDGLEAVAGTVHVRFDRWAADASDITGFAVSTLSGHPEIKVRAGDSTFEVDGTAWERPSSSTGVAFVEVCECEPDEEEPECEYPDPCWEQGQEP